MKTFVAYAIQSLYEPSSRKRPRIRRRLTTGTLIGLAASAAVACTSETNDDPKSDESPYEDSGASASDEATESSEPSDSEPDTDAGGPSSDAGESTESAAEPDAGDLSLEASAPSTADGGGSGAMEPVDAVADGAGEPKTYIVASRVWDDTSTTSYFNVIGSLEPGTEVDHRYALEVPGAAKLFALNDIGWFAVGGGDAPTITRYTLSSEDEMTEQETISLLEYGVGGLWDTLYVVSPTKIYYPDRDNAQLIIINPKEMVVDGVIDLSEAAREGFLTNFGYTPVVHADKLLFTVGWFDWEVNDSVRGETGLFVIDTSTDSVANFEVDSRCGGITTGFVDAQGDAYFVSSALAAAAHSVGRLPTGPCALRVLADAETFDPDYLEDISDLTGADLAGEPVAGEGTDVFLRVFDEDVGTLSEEQLTWEITSQSAWTWWRWDLESGEAALVEDLEASTSDVLWFRVDGHLYGTETPSDYSETTLIDLSAEDGPKEMLVAPGFVHAVARVR